MKPSKEKRPVAKRRRLQKKSEVEESTLEKVAPKVIKSEINLLDIADETLLKILEYLSTKDYRSDALLKNPT